jgi:hypothetical protein
MGIEPGVSYVQEHRLRICEKRELRKMYGLID